MFDRCYVVNLDRRPDLWGQFAAGVPSPWPFPPPRRVPAVDGQTVTPPSWWTAGRGAWGCYQSHLQTIELCIAEGVESVLLLEDDALFAPDFAARATAFLGRLPPDWEMVYLGGQHIKHAHGRPRLVKPGVYRPHNVNRTHAWGLRGSGMQIVRDWLRARDWKPTHHIDHRLGHLVEEGRIRCYVPGQWLVHQRAHHSTISGRELGDSTWRGAADVCYPAIVAVLGQFRGGTSAVAGVLDALGVSMGRGWPRIRGNTNGTFEDRRLAQICRQSYQEPALGELNTSAIRIRRFRRWAHQRGRGMYGAKHPSLCLCVPDLIAAWPDVRFIAVDRPAAESVASLLARRNWGWNPEQANAGIRRLIESRDEALSACSRPVLRIAYDRLLRDTASIVDELIAFLRLEPTDEARQKAIATIDPALRTIPATAA